MICDNESLILFWNDLIDSLNISISLETNSDFDFKASTSLTNSFNELVIRGNRSLSSSLKEDIKIFKLDTIYLYVSVTFLLNCDSNSINLIS